MELRGLAIINLEQTAEALTTHDLAGPYRRYPGRNDFVPQTLVRPFFMIMMQEFSYGDPEVTFAQEYHSLQALIYGEGFKYQVSRSGDPTLGKEPIRGGHVE